MRGYEGVGGPGVRDDLRSRAGERGPRQARRRKKIGTPEVGQSRSQPTRVHLADIFEGRNCFNSPSKSCAVCQWKNGVGAIPGVFVWEFLVIGVRRYMCISGNIDYQSRGQLLHNPSRSLAVGSQLQTRAAA